MIRLWYLCRSARTAHNLMAGGLGSFEVMDQITLALESLACLKLLIRRTEKSIS